MLPAPIELSQHVSLRQLQSGRRSFSHIQGFISRWQQRFLEGTQRSWTPYEAGMSHSLTAFPWWVVMSH